MYGTYKVKFVLPKFREKISVPVNGHAGQHRPLGLGPMCCPKTTVPEQEPRPYNIPERRPHLLKCFNSQNPPKTGKKIPTNNTFPSVASRRIADCMLRVKDTELTKYI